MKLLPFLASLILCLISLPMLAGGNGGGEQDASAAALFSFDEAAVYQSVAELTALEQFVKANDGTILADLQSMNHNLVAGLIFADPSGITLNPLNVLGIPSFVWGICLGPLGLAIVYFVEQDKSETKKAFWGCLINAVIGGIAGGIAGTQ